VVECLPSKHSTLNLNHYNAKKIFLKGREGEREGGREGRKEGRKECILTYL
jgi:hypothetical protein